MTEKNHLNLSMNQIRKERDTVAKMIRVLRPLASAKRVAILHCAEVLLTANALDAE